MSNDKEIKVAAFFKEDEHAELKIFCTRNKISMKDFIYHSVMHCMEEKILPEDKE